MTSSWKQFVAWVTELRDDPFIGPRIKFTLIHFFVVLIVFTLGYQLTLVYRDKALIDSLRHAAIQDSVRMYVVRQLAPSFARVTFWTLVGMGIAVTGISYFLTSITLAQIRQIVRAQKRFIADASHELRTPLSIIKADSEIALFEGQRITTGNALSTIQSNLEEVDRMSKIIENLLALSYYDARVTEIPFTTVDLADVARQLVKNAWSLAERKGVVLTTQELRPAPILGNATAMEQMVMNLIKNAILYTPSGGSVSVSVTRPRPDSAEFSVRDTGIGIAEKDLPHIFNPFYKADHSISKEGSGLGLTIVKKIVERHHGSIAIESAIGKGTLVTVSFPIHE